MATSQSQSLKIKEKLQKQKELIENLLQEIPDDNSAVNEKKIRENMYKQYTKIGEIMQLVDGQVIYDWDEYFMNVACLAALRSKDPRTPVGACIVTADNTIVGIGYNSMPGDIDHDKFPWTSSQNPEDYLKIKDPYVVHAAVNAIANRSVSNLQGCTIYLTLCPDEDCAHAIIQSGISHVKYGMFTRNEQRDEQPDIKQGAQLLRLGKISLSKFKITKEPHVKVKMDGKTKKISLIERINEPKDKEFSGPEKNLIITQTQFFMSLAKLSATKQGRHERHPEHTQGACIVSAEDNRVISVGFSGFPDSINRKAVQTVRDSTNIEDPYICHAEYDAILSKGTPPVKDCTLYITKYPCNDCVKLIIQSGIRKVVYFEEGVQKKTDKKYNMYEASRTILQVVPCSISVHQFTEVELTLQGIIMYGVTEKMFCATDQEQMFNVPRDGIKIVVPPLAISKDTRVDIQLLSSCPFILPTNCQPISCFFQIKTSRKFDKQFKVHLEHYAEVFSEVDSEELGFIISHNIELSLPYHFKFADEANNPSFPVQSKCGIIHIDESSIFAIVWKKQKAEFSNNFKYIWTVYHREIRKNTWELHVVVTKDLKPFKQKAKDCYTDWTEYIGPKKIQFGESTNSIQVQYDQALTDRKMFIQVTHCEINKLEVDKSTLDSSLQHLQLHVDLDITKDDSMDVKLEGMRGGIKSFKFNPTIMTEYEKFDNTETYGMPEISKLESFIVTKVSDKWKSIGYMLNVPDNELATINELATDGNQSCCREMLRKWIELKCAPQTWKTILVILSIVGEQALAREIASKLTQRQD